jgi:drug/metabolite transporter (DMT)-like permease
MNRFERARQANSFPILAVAAAIVTWGFASPLVKYASLSGPAMAFYRVWIGAVVLIVVMRMGRWRITRETLRWAAPAGVVFGGNLLLFVVSIKMTTVANATLIGALQPAIVLLVAGRWFGETVTRREVACVAIAIAGVAVVILGSTGAPEWNPAGDALAMLSVLLFTGYFLVSKQARLTVGTLEYMTVVHLTAAIAVTPFAVAHPGALVSFDPVDVLIVLFFALVSGTAGQMVIGWAHRYVDVTLSSQMMLAVPVVAAATAWLLLGEALGPVQMAGSAITLVAIGAMIRRPPAAVAEAVAPVPGVANPQPSP